MPTWKTSFQIFVLLSIGGLALIIASGFWHIIALCLLGVIAAWLWSNWASPRS